MNGERELVGDFELPSHVSSPEGKLMLAMLERAVLDFVGNDVRERDEATAWLFDWSESDVDDPHEFSFPWVCDYLGLDPYRISAVVKAMPKRGENRIAPWYFAPNLKPLGQSNAERPKVLGEKRYLKAA